MARGEDGMALCLVDGTGSQVLWVFSAWQPAREYHGPFCPREVREHTSFRQSPYSRTSQSPCCAMCPGSLPDDPPETVSSTLPSEKCGSEGFSKDVSQGVVLEQDEEGKNLQWWNADRQDNYCAPFAKG